MFILLIFLLDLLEKIAISIWILMFQQLLYGLLVDFNIAKGCFPLVTLTGGHEIDVEFVRGTQEEYAVEGIFSASEVSVGPGCRGATPSVTRMRNYQGS